MLIVVIFDRQHKPEINFFLCDYMPESVQEKRTEVLENKVDRM